MRPASPFSLVDRCAAVPADSAPNDETLFHLRTDYTRDELTEDEANSDPFALFAEWLQVAIGENLPEPNAMTLVTATADAIPSGRIVLLRGHGPDGFKFYTNYTSRKGSELAENSSAGLTFFWPELQRQVRVSGTVHKLPDAESDAYFASRPRGSQLGAWASDQSAPLDGRATLERKLEEVTERFDGQDVPRPPHWGGYRLEPVAIEFWQGRSSRLHDRLLYERGGDDWTVRRLWP